MTEDYLEGCLVLVCRLGREKTYVCIVHRCSELEKIRAKTRGIIPAPLKCPVGISYFAALSHEPGPQKALQSVNHKYLAATIAISESARIGTFLLVFCHADELQDVPNAARVN